MTILEIKTLENGSHRNQTSDFEVIPEGWAVIPDDLETINFPFGEVTVEEVDGVMTVTKWIAGTIPEIIEEERPVSDIEQLQADIVYIALMTGVKL